MIEVTLRGEPRGKGRPRFSSAGKFVRVYTDKKTRDYEKALALAGRVAMRGKQQLRGALFVTVMAIMAVPKSWPNRRRDAALTGAARPMGRGTDDCDNLAKMLDALNGVVWADDAAVVDLRVAKFYGEEPMLRVEVKQLEAFAEEGDERAALHPPALTRVAAGG